MIRTALISFTAAALVPNLAHAATYIGTLNGIITSGSESYFQMGYDGPPTYFTTDLVGDAITISFQVDVTANYLNPFGDVVPRYVVVATNVSIPALTGVGVGLNNIGSTQNNDPDNFYTSADFSGNGVNGTVSSSGSFAFNEPDFSQSVSFSYLGAGPIQGALGGSGTVDTSWYNGRDTNDDYSVGFQFTDGYVTATGTPEPASWALMLLGLGVIGWRLRRPHTVPRFARA